MFFSFPEDARWNTEREVVEFGIGIGEYEGVARVPRRVFQRLLDGAVTQSAAWRHTTSSGLGSSWRSSESCAAGTVTSR